MMLPLSPPTSHREKTMPPRLYVGTLQKAYHAQENPSAFGIYRWDHDGEGWRGPALTPTPQPGWLVISPCGGFLYAMNELREVDGVAGGAITAFAIHPRSGDLIELNRRKTGGNPCHGAIDATGRYLLVSTFHGGMVEMFPLAPDGLLGEAVVVNRHQGSSLHPKRQTAPHPHGIAITPDNRLVLVPDLGTDRIEVYELDAVQGTLRHLPEAALVLPPLSGPRHALISPSGQWAYIIAEMSAQIMVVAIETPHRLRLVQCIDLLPAQFSGLRSGGELVWGDDGRFLYATTRSHGSSGMPDKPGVDGLYWLAIDQDSGLLTLAGSRPAHGLIPRDCAVADGGLWVAHQASSLLSWHPIDRATGALGAAEHVLETPVPACIIPCPAAKTPYQP
ncbi:lactonase family protein [Novosphingobium umbonatum]|uniref:Lactonase family protein n=1 Tax=Novosphingobium umbonatum TaxID=1908524 RepID=A0A3S2URZ4_9SPHN|nr:lactonase family protein [Novosphingobium umbonatum]